MKQIIKSINLSLKQASQGKVKRIITSYDKKIYSQGYDIGHKKGKSESRNLNQKEIMLIENKVTKFIVDFETGILNYIKKETIIPISLFEDKLLLFSSNISDYFKEVKDNKQHLNPTNKKKE